MQRMERSFEVAAPVHAAYEQWLRLDEVRDARIVQRDPDRLLVWHGGSSAPSAGVARFEALGRDRTRIAFALEYSTPTPPRNGDEHAAARRRIDKAIDDFLEHFEPREGGAGDTFPGTPGGTPAPGGGKRGARSGGTPGRR